jgi:hypothetical protein
MLSAIAFDGAFFGWPYHAGVAACVQQHGDCNRAFGASSGAVIAAMLACGIDLATVGLELGLRADRRGVGRRRTPFFHPRAFLAPHLDELDQALPADAHLRATGRLHITLRRVRPWRRFVVSHYPTRASLIDALRGAVAIPGLTVRFVHWSPSFGAVLDGGSRAIDDGTALRVGVHPGSAEIAPRTAFARAALWSVGPDRARRWMFECGYTDARNYLDRRG